MREGMVRRRGLTSGGERLLVDLPETSTLGRMLVVLLHMNRGGRGDFASELRATAKPMTTPNYPCSLAVLCAAKSGDEVSALYSSSVFLF